MSPTPPGDDEPRRDATAVVVEQREQLIAAARAVTGLDRHSAEDVVSIVTERVLRTGAAPRHGEAWLSYMHQAVVRQASREAQRVQRTAAADSEALSGLDPAVDAVAARLRWLDAMEDLRTLPDDEREVFVLRHYEGLTYRAVASATNLTEDEVDHRLRRASARLRERRAEREMSPAYLLLALFASSARRGVLSGPPAVAVAGAAALAMLGVLAVPAPHVVQADSATPVPVARPFARPGADGREAAGTSRDARQAPHALAALPPAASRPAPRPGTPTPDSFPLGLPVSVCAGPACLTTGGGPQRRRGDVITVKPVPGLAVAQQVISVCREVPDNPAVGCEADHPENYRAQRPEQDPGGDDGKSNPSAPIGEPPKGPPA